MIYDTSVIAGKVSHYWGQWLKNPGLTWAVGPVACYIVGYTLPAIALEWVIRTDWARDKFITHIKGTDRVAAIQKTQTKVPFWKQVKCVLMQLFGPTAIFNGFLGYTLANRFLQNIEYPLTPTLSQGALQVVSLLFVQDFFLYWGHRIQHDIPFLWKNCHSLHHTLDTPTPVGTIYIDSVDATLQGALPMICAASIVRPHPLSAYIFVLLRLTENVINHTGLESTFLNCLLLKCLPGRATVTHHDYHHKFSNYTGNAKNYAEFFLIWDWLFGTLTTPGDNKSH